MAKSNSTSNKAKTKSSSNGCSKSAKNIRNENSKKTVHRSSVTGKFISRNNNEKVVSESDQLTLRAWKKTFENRKKAA
jgi:hypothetical protein